MTDRADPLPASPSAAPLAVHAVFRDTATGTARTQLVEAGYSENHLVYAPAGTPPGILHTRVVGDANGDGEFEELHDVAHTAIARMNVDGTRPVLLTDVDAQGAFADDGFVDTTPEWSPDGAHVLFSSSRAGAAPALRLWAMDADGSDIRPVLFEPGGAPVDGVELDADPQWGPGNRVAWKRAIIAPPTFSRVMTGTIDPATMTISGVATRTDGPPGTFATNTPGDFDPKISPDGAWIASYRHLDDAFTITYLGDPVTVGDWDLWIGPFSDPAQPGDASIAFLEVDDRVGDFLPRWNLTGDKLAFWSVDFDAFDAGGDAQDIVVVDVATGPGGPATSNRTNITAGVPGDWREGMPAWSTDPADPDTLIYSAMQDPFD